MAPVYSISEYYNAPEIPLFLMAAIQTFSIGRGELYGLCNAGSFAADWQHLWRNVCVAAHFSLPPLLSVSGLTNAKWLSTYPLFHICALFGASTQAIGIMVLFIALITCYLCSEFLFAHFK